jgi:hypothetical protein
MHLLKSNQSRQVVILVKCIRFNGRPLKLAICKSKINLQTVVLFATEEAQTRDMQEQKKIANCSTNRDRRDMP